MKNVVSILIVSFLLAFPIHWYDQQALASIEKMLSFVSGELDSLKSSSFKVPASARHVFLPAALVEANLNQLREYDNNPFKVHDISALGRLWRLFKASLLRMYG